VTDMNTCTRHLYTGMKYLLFGLVFLGVIQFTGSAVRATIEVLLLCAAFVVGNIQGYKEGLARMPSLHDEGLVLLNEMRDESVDVFVDSLVQATPDDPNSPSILRNPEQLDALKDDIKKKVREVYKPLEDE